MLGMETSYAAIHGMLRTLAHIAVFLVFGALLEAAVIETTKAAAGAVWKIHRLLIVMLACAVVAVLSEVLKIYIPGRHLDWPEAGLNVIGAWLGCGGMYAVERLCEVRKRV